MIVRQNPIRVLLRRSTDHKAFRARRRRTLEFSWPIADDFRLEDRTLLSNNFPLSDSSWTALGPAPVNNATGSGSPVSGRITGIAADPSGPEAGVYYIATAGGGVWKTYDGGAIWTPLTDDQATLSMGAIALAPSNASVVYAGTGEANNSADSNYGEGILYSGDGGASWALENDGGVFFGLTVSKIAVDPTDPNVVYAAMGNRGNNQDKISGTGIYKSINHGMTWTNTTASITTTESYSDVEIDPSNPGTVYMAIGSLYGSAENGVYKSINGGSTWTLLSGVPSGVDDGRISIAIAASSTNEVYVCIAGDLDTTGSGLYAFLRSDNYGAYWTDLTSGTPNFMGDQGWYDQVIAVDPKNAGIIFAGGQVGSGNPLGLNTDAIIESQDYGVDWTSIAGDAAGDPHTDHHAMAFDANGALLDGNDGGIWRLDNPTANPDETAIAWDNLNSNLNTIQFEGIGLDPTDDSIALGGSQDNGAERFTDNLGWTQVDNSDGPGDGGSVKFSNQNPDRVYRVAPVDSFGDLSFFRVSNDGGKTWTAAANGLGFFGSSPQNFYPPFAVDPSNGDRVLIGSNQLYETTNGASTWNLLADVNQNGFNPDGEIIDAIGLAASDSMTIYVATGGYFASSSHIYATTNGGASWSQVDLPGGSGRVSDLEVDPNHSQTVYATVSTFGVGHVFKSTNGGGTWQDISGNLPNLPTWTLQLDPTTGHLFVGNDTGVFVSTNNGTTWNRMGSGLPNVQVFQLALNTYYGTLAAATHGRGMWEILSNPTGIKRTYVEGPVRYFDEGDPLTIYVEFSDRVIVEGSLSLALNSGGTAYYTSGSGTNTLTFTYIAGVGDYSAQLDYTSTDALSAVTGGTIIDANGNYVDLTLPPPGSPGSISGSASITVNGLIPAVQHYYVLFGSQRYDLIGSTRYDLPWQIKGIEVVFNKPITTADADSLTGLSTTRLSGLGTNTLTWSISTITQGMFATTLVSAGPDAIRDAAGAPMHNPFSQNFKVLYGDFNGTGYVDLTDVIGILLQIRQPYDNFADLNGDGIVDGTDVLIAASRVGRRL